MLDKIGNKFRLYQAKDYYSVCMWISMFHQRMECEKGDRYNTRMQYKILSLKRGMRNKDFINKIVKKIKGYFGCNSIVVIPSSKKGFSNLQKMLHSYVFERTEQVPSRKYQQTGGLELTEGVKVDLSDIKGKILLIDDIITTGTTMDAFAGKLKDFECAKFGIAINHKLEPVQIDKIEIQDNNEDVLTDLDINEYKIGLKDVICQDIK